MANLFARFFGARKVPVEAAPTVVLTATVQVRDVTPAEVAEAHSLFTKAFNWVLQEIDISPSNRRTLLGVLLPKYNAIRISRAEIEAAGVALSWPRAEAAIAARNASEFDERIADIEALGPADALARVKVADLKRIAAAHGVEVQGRATKAALIEAVMHARAPVVQAVRSEAVSALRSGVALPVVATWQVVELLHLRVCRAATRIRRNRQVLDMLKEKRKFPYTHIRVEAFAAEDGVADCGLRDGEIRPAAQLIDRLTQPLCPALDCRCSFAPHSPSLERAKAR